MGINETSRERIEQAVKALEDRNAAICDAYNEGASLREIAKAAKLSHAGVRWIIISNSKGQA